MAPTLLAALRAAQRRGVAVTLVVDAFGQRLGGVLMSAGQREALASELRRAARRRRHGHRLRAAAVGCSGCSAAAST